LIFAVLSSSFSSVATLFKVRAVQTLPPFLAASTGVLAGGLIMAAYIALRGQLPSLARIRAIWRPLAVLVLLRPVASNLLFTLGCSMTTGIKAVFLTKMEPYLVIFWAWMLDGRRPSREHLSLLAVHVFGALLLTSGDLAQFAMASAGDIIIFLSVITAALSYRFAPKVTSALSPTETSAVVGTFGGAVSLPFVLLVSPLPLGAGTLSGWTFLAIHTLLFYVFAISFWYASLQHIQGWLSSALRATGPVVALPIAWLAFGDRLTAVQALGALIVLVTSALISKVEKRESMQTRRAA
jgi:probable blue pigment (indigoidine) exporter